MDQSNTIDHALCWRVLIAESTWQMEFLDAFEPGGMRERLGLASFHPPIGKFAVAGPALTTPRRGRQHAALR